MAVFICVINTQANVRYKYYLYRTSEDYDNEKKLLD